MNDGEHRDIFSPANTKRSPFTLDPVFCQIEHWIFKYESSPFKTKSMLLHISMIFGLIPCEL